MKRKKQKSRRTGLPDSARAFLRTIETTLRPNTCLAYAAALNDLFRFLRQERVDFRGLNRSHTAAWLANLSDRGLAPATRLQRINAVRLYLGWLYDEDLLPIAPSRLIFATDYPKLPDYLPRALPPREDAILQRELERSDKLYDQGLLLMRYTGIRVGELLALPYDCARKDHAGFSYLKVPLGKLNNERLVPLHDRAVALIKAMKANTPRKRALLVVSHTGRKADRAYINRALQRICGRAGLSERITSHQLRHTLASSLLGAGMSIFHIKEILGHRSLKMTLRYLKASPEDIAREFLSATTKLQEKYELAVTPRPAEKADSSKLIADAIRLLSHKSPAALPKQKRLIIRRLERVHADLRKLGKAPRPQ